MPKVRLVGRILPSAITVSASSLPSTRWNEPDLEMTFRVNIVNSRMEVECELDKWNKDLHFMPVYMRAMDIARAHTDLFSFQWAIGLTVTFETFIDTNGSESALLVQQPELKDFATSTINETSPQHFNENNFDIVLRRVIENFSAMGALHDLNEAITQTHASPRACGRAVEGIRQAIAPGLERKKGWAQMNETLRIDRSYLDLITDTSIGPRHADPAHVTGARCREITKRSWIIMNRFLEYLKRGSQPLPESEFSTLR
jgi:hypothetical protein